MNGNGMKLAESKLWVPSPSGQRILPPWLFEPAESESLNEHAGVALPAIGATATVLTFTVPDGRNGVINLIANVFIGGGFVEFGGLIVWRILIDDAAVRNYQNIVASFGSISNPSRISPIRIYERQVVTLQVENVAPGVIVAGQTIGGRLGGYYYSRALDESQEFF